jgi:hypothetical protein
LRRVAVNVKVNIEVIDEKQKQAVLEIGATISDVAFIVVRN